MAVYYPQSAAPALNVLVKAALEQRKPSPRLVRALNEILTLTNHPLALKKKERQTAAA